VPKARCQYQPSTLDASTSSFAARPSVVVPAIEMDPLGDVRGHEMAVVEALPRSFCLCCIDLLCFQGVGLLLHGTSSLLGISSAAAAGFVAGIDDDELIVLKMCTSQGASGAIPLCGGSQSASSRWRLVANWPAFARSPSTDVVSVEGGAPEDNLDSGKGLRHRAVGLRIHRCELEIVL